MTRRRGLALAAALIAGSLAAPARPATLQPPRLTRAEMEAQLANGPRFWIVYGTQQPSATPALRAEAERLAANLFGAGGDTLLADRDASEDSLAAHGIVLIGAPRENLWTRRANQDDAGPVSRRRIPLVRRRL